MKAIREFQALLITLLCGVSLCAATINLSRGGHHTTPGLVFLTISLVCVLHLLHLMGDKV